MLFLKHLQSTPVLLQGYWLNMSFRVGYDKKAGIITSDRPAIIKSGEFPCEEYTKRLDLFLMADDREVLQDAGKITAEIAKAKAETSDIMQVFL